MLIYYNKLILIYVIKFDIIPTNQQMNENNMTTIAKTIREPSYYHREFKNDVPALKKAEEHSKNTLIQQFSRVALVALPYVSLYRSVGVPLSCMLGAFRTCTSIAQTINSLGDGDIKNASYGLVQTTISAVAVAGTIFAHPAGMLISTTHDLLIETCQLIHHLQNKNQKEALNSCLNLFNNALYLSLFMYGGLELSILSLAGQILLGMYHAQNEYRSGHWLEAAGHVGMAAVRSNQLLVQVHALRISLAMQEPKNQDGRKSTRSRTKTAEARNKPHRERNKTAQNKTARAAASPHNTPPTSASNDKPVSSPSQEKAADSAAPQTNAPIPKTLSERVKEYESNSEGWPSLHYAIHMNDEEAAQHFINTKHELAQMSTPSIPIMKFQMGKNADKDRDNRWGTESGISSIELAIRHRCTTSFVERLLASGADFKGVRKEYYGDIRDTWESTTTYVHEKNKLAHFFGNAEEYQLFTPIYWAIVNKDKALFDLLISKGCSLNDLAYMKRALNRGTSRIEEVQYTAQQLLEKIGS
jgi:ankyrin repeat protein